MPYSTSRSQVFMPSSLQAFKELLEPSAKTAIDAGGARLGRVVCWHDSGWRVGP